MGRFGGWGNLANGKRGTSAYIGADSTGERKGLPGEKAKEENQRQGSVQLQKRGTLTLFVEVTTQGLLQLELSQTVLL